MPLIPIFQPPFHYRHTRTTVGYRNLFPANVDIVLFIGGNLLSAFMAFQWTFTSSGIRHTVIVTRGPRSPTRSTPIQIPLHRPNYLDSDYTPNTLLQIQTPAPVLRLSVTFNPPLPWPQKPQYPSRNGNAQHNHFIHRPARLVLKALESRVHFHSGGE
jgi:hypothetical protein